MPTLEETFWARVWQCTHRHPCNRCCWPWCGFEGPAIYDDPILCRRRSWDRASLKDPELPRLMTVSAVAYMLGKVGGQLIFPGRLAYVCHACDYASCCNPAHLSLGAPADNYRDKRGKPRGKGSLLLRPQVTFPDGRQWPFR
jgi:hypothetical protein